MVPGEKSIIYLPDFLGSCCMLEWSKVYNGWLFRYGIKYNTRSLNPEQKYLSHKCLLCTESSNVQNINSEYKYYLTVQINQKTSIVLFSVVWIMIFINVDGLEAVYGHNSIYFSKFGFQSGWICCANSSVCSSRDEGPCYAKYYTL